jgi:hypothetical protein
MSVGSLILVTVLAESIVLLFAVRWLVGGLREAGAQDWPPVLPLTAAGVLPTPRDGAPRADETAVAGS